LYQTLFELQALESGWFIENNVVRDYSQNESGASGFRFQEYDMTIHAMEEMAEDNLDILDLEHARFRRANRTN
jgi:hypothetical protein